jgi:hypothetical protein
MNVNDITTAGPIIRAAKLPEEVFGIPDDKREPELLEYLKREYRRLATMLHPDKFPDGPERIEATELFSLLTNLKNEACLSG